MTVLATSFVSLVSEFGDCPPNSRTYGVIAFRKWTSSSPFIMYSVAVLLSWQMYSKSSVSPLQRKSNPPLHGRV